MKISIKIILAIGALLSYTFFLNTFGVEFGLDAAMLQMENTAFNYAPSEFVRAVNNYGWMAVALFWLLLFRKEILAFINKKKKNTTSEDNT